ncbi:MAG: UDP-glucose 4-epimerase GalE [Mycoplasma sp.]|nr:UDP-glucose 4-epimerase GalE [Mycoplasma sp.]
MKSKKMNVLVTGGAGYIGSHTVYELLREKHTVVVLDNLSTGNIEAVPKDVKFYEGDLRDSNTLDKIFSENKIDAVIHTSAKLIVPESIEEPIKYFENNVHGVAVLLESMRKANVKNIVFSSTAAVYGKAETFPIKEDAPKKPIQPYGMSKLACEWLIEAAKPAYGFNYVIFRYFNVAGADDTGEIGESTKGMELTHLVPVVIQTIVGEREQMSVFGNDYDTRDGSCVRDYVHVNDLAKAHIKGALYTLEGKSDIFNLGSENGFTVLEVLEKTKKHLKVDINYKIDSRRPGDPDTLVASNKKVKELLNWTNEKSLEEMIESDYRWRTNKKF